MSVLPILESPRYHAAEAALQLRDPRARVELDSASGRLRVETRLDEATVRAALQQAGIELPGDSEVRRRHGGGECCGGCSGG